MYMFLKIFDQLHIKRTRTNTLFVFSAKISSEVLDKPDRDVLFVFGLISKAMSSANDLDCGLSPTSIVSHSLLYLPYDLKTLSN